MMMNGMNETGDHNNNIGAAFNDELKKSIFPLD